MIVMYEDTCMYLHIRRVGTYIMYLQSMAYASDSYHIWKILEGETMNEIF